MLTHTTKAIILWCRYADPYNEGLIAIVLWCRYADSYTKDNNFVVQVC